MFTALIVKYAANLKVWAGFGLCLLATLAGLQTARLSHAKTDLAAARAALLDPATHRTWRAEAAEEAASLSAAEAALGEQDAAVAALKAAGQAAATKARAAVAQARVRTTGAADQAASLLKARPGPDGCKSADALILHSLGGPQ